MRLAGPIALVLAGPRAAMAAAAGPVATPAAPVSTTGSAFYSLLQTSISLLLVLGVILGLAWVARRLKLAPLNRSADLAVLAEVSVGVKERVVLLKVGDAQALVGVGADGVRSLSLLTQRVEIQATSAPDGPFAARLAEALKGAPKP